VNSCIIVGVQIAPQSHIKIQMRSSIYFILFIFLFTEFVIFYFLVCVLPLLFVVTVGHLATNNNRPTPIQPTEAQYATGHIGQLGLSSICGR